MHPYGLILTIAEYFPYRGHDRNVNQIEPNRQFVRLSIRTAICVIVWVAIAVFWIELRIRLWPFGQLLYGVVALTWAYYFWMSSGLIGQQFKKLKFKSLTPLAILLCGMICIVAIDPVWLDFQLRFKQHALPIVPSLVRQSLSTAAGQTEVNVDLDIPVARHIAMARDERGTSIFFTRYTVGFGDASVGYTYRSDDSDSKIHNPPSGPMHRKIADHWFWGIDPFDTFLEQPAF